MEKLGYTSYDEYRQETNRRVPKTQEAYKKRLDKRLDTLYRQKDFRALEVIMELSEALAGEDENLYYDLYFATMGLMETTPTRRSIIVHILR